MSSLTLEFQELTQIEAERGLVRHSLSVGLSDLTNSMTHCDVANAIELH